MKSIEERLRTATRAAADAVLPGSAPPLRLPERAGLVRRGRLGWLRRSPWAAPLAAAAGVAAVVGGTLVAVQVVGSGAAPANLPAARHKPGLNPLLAHPDTVDGLPPFFITPTAGPLMAAAGRHWVASAAIVSTATGQVVARPRLPGLAYQVAAAGDGRTFYAAVTHPACRPGRRARAGVASRGVSTASTTPAGPSPVPGTPPAHSGGQCGPGRGQAPIFFYRIALTSDGAQVSKLPIAPVTGMLDGISPSPDGAGLAIVTYSTQGNEGFDRVLTVASTASGTSRTWTTRQPGGLGGGAMPITWLANGHGVAFPWLQFSGTASALTLRTLDTSAPGSDLLAGPAVMNPDSSGSTFKPAIMSADGRTVLAVEERDGAVVNGQSLPMGSVVALSARTGQPTGVLFTAGRRRDGAYLGCQILWVGQTGRKALLSCDFSPAGSSVSRSRVFLAQAGRAPRPLRWLSSLRITPGALGEP